MAFESERKKILLSKLTKRYVENLEVQSIEVKAFKSGLSVQSFTTEKLPAELQKDLETVREVLNAESEARERAQKAPEQEAQRIAEEAAEAFASGDFDKAKKMRQETQAKSAEGKGADGAGTAGAAEDDEDEDGDEDAAAHRADTRKRMRAKRKLKMVALEKRKPAVNDVDPNDVAVIKWVQRNVGDYKLKTAKDYVVPESMRINAEKKRQQLIVLKEKVYEIEMEHNEKFLQMRDNKREIIAEVADYNRRLREIAEELGEDPPALWEPEVDPEEVGAHLHVTVVIAIGHGFRLSAAVQHKIHISHTSARTHARTTPHCSSPRTWTRSRRRRSVRTCGRTKAVQAATTLKRKAAKTSATWTTRRWPPETTLATRAETT